MTPPFDRVAFVAADAPRTQAIRIEVQPGEASAAMAWWRQRPVLPARFELPRYELPELPTLDDAWTLWLYESAEPPGSWEAMCRYVEDARQGRWTDRVPVEVSVQAVYLALAQEALLGAKNSARFLEEVWTLFTAVAAQLAAGRSLLDDPALLHVPALQRHVAALKEDHRLYLTDPSQQRDVTLPPEACITGGARAAKLLVLVTPASSQFKLWARRDGFSMLLVQQRDGLLVLSVDPTARVRLSALAPLLGKADRAPWYDGSRHEGTLIASPLDGTQLRAADVLRVLGGWARLRKSSRAPRVAVAAAVVLVAGVAFGLRAAPLEDSKGAKGEPIPAAQTISLLAAADGPKSFTSYALVAGVCGYTGDRALSSPCRDAREVRKLLIARLGYAPENILYLVDQPEADEATDGVPTAANLRLQVEKFRARTQAREESSFLFYYSGHGGYEKGARKDYGVLQPSGYFEHPELPMSDRGWDMQELLDGIRKGVPSRHVMVVLDACYSGWAVGAKGEAQLGGAMHSLWKERAEVVITAGTKGQRAWEDETEEGGWQWGGHSALTAFLLEGLGASGSAAADSNADRVVTDEELAKYLRARVPVAVRESKRSEQTPQFFRFDEHLPKSGQFLFLPRP